MGYDNTDSLRVVIDIETVSLPDASNYLEPVEAPSNYKDPQKITAYIAERSAKNLAEAGLDVDLNQIVAIGWLREDGHEPTVLTADVDDEDAMIRCFWQQVEQRAMVGYNLLGFDLPALLRRSLYLGIPTPPVNLDKYRTQHIDLQQRLSYNGLLKWRSLDFYCKRFNIPCEDTAVGSEIEALVKAGEWAAVAKRCRSDVLRTKTLAERMGLLQQYVPVQEAAF